MPSKLTKNYRTSSSEETKLLGEKFAREILDTATQKRAGAAIIVLSGPLGSGKTTFTQGFLKGAGIRGRAPSPTFIIMRHYKIPRGAKKGFSEVFHMDAYRLKEIEGKRKISAHAHPALAPLGLGEIMNNPANIVLIEWGERIGAALPRGTFRLRFRYGKKEGKRTISIK